MARPRSDDKRNAILAATIRVINSQGLSAPTSLLAREADVSNGTLFIYFKTKAELYNQLYLQLKEEMVAALTFGISSNADLKDQLFQMWSNWMNWARTSPDKKRALALLAVAEELNSDTRAMAQKKMASLENLVERCRKKGVMQDAPLHFVAAIMNSIGETTMDFIIQDPANAEKHSRMGFDALWRAIS